MSAIKRIWTRARALSFEEIVLLAESVFQLARAALTLKFFPFKRIAGQLGKVRQAREDDFAISPMDGTTALIGWSIRTAARHVPWPALCLVQAMAGAKMLKRRGRKFRIVLGTQTDDNDRMIAHAWLLAGDAITGGHETPKDYILLATFERG